MKKEHNKIYKNNTNNNNINMNNNKEIPLNNLNNNNPKNAYFNSSNFSFKPTNIQQVSSEEINKFIQSIQSQQKQITRVQIPISQQQMNNNINQNLNQI